MSKQLELPFTRNCDFCDNYYHKVFFFKTNVKWVENRKMFAGGLWLCSHCIENIMQDKDVMIVSRDKNLSISDYKNLISKYTHEDDWETHPPAKAVLFETTFNGEHKCFPLANNIDEYYIRS
jgi:hypothetical protein